MGIQASSRIFEELCPNCGKEVDKLNPFTGFCDGCSASIEGKQVCDTCGNEFVPFQKSRTTCTSCRWEQWLRRNADSIERVMFVRVVSFTVAAQVVLDDNRPRCAMCGDKIKHGTKGRTIFCSKRDECRRAAIRYSVYRKRNRLSDDEALEKAIHGR